jgi:DNA polymerase-3 subunit delta'
MFEEFDLDEDDDLGGTALSSAQDAEAGLMPPPQSSICFGHEQIEQQIISLYNTGKMPHAIALTGPKGIGKATLAYRIAKFLFHEDVSAQDALFGLDEAAATSLGVPVDSPSFQKVASGGHPDLIRIEREYDDVKGETKGALLVDAIRRVPTFLRSTSALGGWRICVIDDADTMNRQAQNALLKTLEEPPKKTLIILVAHRMGTFLPTIKSRIRVFNCAPLNDNDFNQLLDLSDVETQAKELVYALSSGCFGYAQMLLEDGGLDVIDKVFSCFVPDRVVDPLLAMTIADQIGARGADKTYGFFVLFMTRLMEAMVMIKAKQEEFLDDALIKSLSKQQNFDVLQEFFQRQTLENLIEKNDKLREHFERTERAYLDKRLAVQQALDVLAGR